MATGETRTAHNLLDRKRTTDVLSSENINVDFASLLLSEEVQKGLTCAGFERPSPIQLKAIPLGRCGLDLIVQAKSGTGKTCVFSVIALESVITSSSSLQVLVLAPTREIAVQIQSVILAIGSAMDALKCHTFIGGTIFGQDRQNLKKCHIAVGTPGRIKQLIEYEVLKTDSVRLFILDEADKLLDEKFQASVNWIYHQLPENKQMLSLSATYPESLAQQLTNYMRDPTFVRLNPKDLVLQGIKQFYKIVPGHELPHKAFQIKADRLIAFLSQIAFNQCLIFSNLQSRAQHLCDLLLEKGWPATYISGNQEQIDRMRAMMELKTYKCRILISTDLTARGIDAENVNLIINLDVPKDFKTYLHRIGRAGRFGTHGAAITLATEGQEVSLLRNVQKRSGSDIRMLPDPLPSNLLEMSSSDVRTATLEPKEEDPVLSEKDTSDDCRDPSTDVTESAETRSVASFLVQVSSQTVNDEGRERIQVQNGHNSPIHSSSNGHYSPRLDGTNDDGTLANGGERSSRPYDIADHRSQANDGSGDASHRSVTKNGHINRRAKEDDHKPLESSEGGIGVLSSPAIWSANGDCLSNGNSSRYVDSLKGRGEHPVKQRECVKEKSVSVHNEIGSNTNGMDISTMTNGVYNHASDIERENLTVKQYSLRKAPEDSTLIREELCEERSKDSLDDSKRQVRLAHHDEKQTVEDPHWRKKGLLEFMGLKPSDWTVPLQIVQQARGRTRKQWTFEEALYLFEGGATEQEMVDDCQTGIGKGDDNPPDSEVQLESGDEVNDSLSLEANGVSSLNIPHSNLEEGESARTSPISQTKAPGPSFEENYKRLENCDILAELRDVRALSHKIKSEIATAQEDTSKFKNFSGDHCDTMSRLELSADINPELCDDVARGLTEFGDGASTIITEDCVQEVQERKLEGSRQSQKVQADNRTSKKKDKLDNVSAGIKQGAMRKSGVEGGMPSDIQGTNRALENHFNKDITALSEGNLAADRRTEQQNHPESECGKESMAHMESGHDGYQTDSFVKGAKEPVDASRTSSSKKQSRKGQRQRKIEEITAIPRLVKGYSHCTSKDLAKDCSAESCKTSDKIWEYFKLWVRSSSPKVSTGLPLNADGVNELNGTVGGNLLDSKRAAESPAMLDQWSLYSNKSAATYLKSEKVTDRSSRNRRRKNRLDDTESLEEGECSLSDAANISGDVGSLTELDHSLLYKNKYGATDQRYGALGTESADMSPRKGKGKSRLVSYESLEEGECSPGSSLNIRKVVGSISNLDSCSLYSNKSDATYQRECIAQSGAVDLSPNNRKGKLCGTAGSIEEGECSPEDLTNGEQAVRSWNTLAQGPFSLHKSSKDYQRDWIFQSGKAFDPSIRNRRRKYHLEEPESRENGDSPLRDLQNSKGIVRSLLALDQCSLYSNKSDATYQREHILHSENVSDASKVQRHQKEVNESLEEGECSPSDEYTSDEDGSSVDEELSLENDESRSYDNYGSTYSTRYKDSTKKGYHAKTDGHLPDCSYHQERRYLGRGREEEFVDDPYVTPYFHGGTVDGWGHFYPSSWKMPYQRGVGSWGHCYSYPPVATGYFSGGYPYYYDDYQ